MSTDVPQINLRDSSPRNRTPTNENLTLNRSTSSDEQRSIPNSSSPLRSFVALFDYDPEAMSPNEDIDEELPFKKGQVIKVSSDSRIPSKRISSFSGLRRSRCRWILSWSN